MLTSVGVSRSVLDCQVYWEFVALLDPAGGGELFKDGLVGFLVGVGGWHGRAGYGVQVAGACVTDLCLDAADGGAR